MQVKFGDLKAGECCYFNSEIIGPLGLDDKAYNAFCLSTGSRLLVDPNTLVIPLDATFTERQLRLGDPSLKPGDVVEILEGGNKGAIGVLDKDCYAKIFCNECYLSSRTRLPVRLVDNIYDRAKAGAK